MNSEREPNESLRNNSEKEQFYPGNFKILTPREFFTDFQEYANQATGRVYAQTMYAEAGFAFGAIANALIRAKVKGIDAALHIDSYTFMIDGQQVRWIPSIKLSKQRERINARKAKRDVITDLEAAHVTVKITNPPNIIEKILPFVGRNHMKLAVVDNTAWVGGVSFRDEDLPKEDFMMRITDPRISSVLADQFNKVNGNREPQDLYYPCTSDTIVAVDRGDRGKSIIFDHALEAAQNAQRSIKLITQYSLNGTMADELFHQYKLNKDIKAIVSSHFSIEEWFARIFDTANHTVTNIRKRNIPTLYSPTRVHAKALLVDGELPESAIGMVGSHNLTRSGVYLGTQELAVFSRNSDFIKNLSEYFKELERRIILQGI